MVGERGVDMLDKLKPKKAGGPSVARPLYAQIAALIMPT